MFRKNENTPGTTKRDLLRQLPIFAGYSKKELSEVEALVDEAVVQEGASLTVEGRPGREVFIILSGTAEVRRGGDLIGTVGAGDVVGEMAILDHGPRSATVTATSQLQVLVLDPRSFAALFTQPGAAHWIATELSQRLRGLDEAQARA